MKKRIIVFAVVIMFVLGCMVSPAMAAVSESNRGTALRIDNQTQYMGMDSTYKDGYSPTVADNQANIILPLIASGGSQQVKAGEPINISVNLGDPQKAPFVFNNYNEKVTLENNKLADGTVNPVKSYLVDLNLPLSDSRLNGNYPVVITAKYPIADGTIKMQEFTVFVKITDGKDPTDPGTEPTTGPAEPVTPEEPGGGDAGGGSGGGGIGGPTSQPKVIISNYQISPDPVNAGEKFSVKVTLLNTSKSVTVKNITVTFKSQTTDLMPGDNTNTVYVEKIAPQKTAEFSFTMAARADAKAGPQKIDIAIAYEDNQAAQLTAADEISVEVHQKIRLEYDPPKFPTQLYMGDTASASLNLYNKGKNTLYNVTVTLDVPGLTPESSAFLGNMESGTAKTADIYASVAPDPNAGMGGAMDGFADGEAAAYDAKIAEEQDATVIGGADAPTGISISSEEMGGKEAAEQIGGGLSPETGGGEDAMIQPGPVEGNFVVTYEDEYGEEYEIKVPVSTELVPMPDYGGGMEPGEEFPEEPQGFPWWGWVIIAGGAAAAVIIVVVKKKKKKRAQELEEEMDDDDIL